MSHNSKMIKSIGLGILGTGFSTLSYGIDIVPTSLSTGKATDGDKKVYIDYSKRSGLSTALDQPSAKDRATVENTTLGAVFGFSEGWKLGLSIKGVSSTSQLGFDHGLATSRIQLEKSAQSKSGISIGMGSFLDSGVSSGDVKESIAREKDTSGSLYIVGRFDNDQYGIDMNAGKKFRLPKTFLKNRIRHEIFYSLGAELKANKTLSVFGRVNGRELQVANLDSIDNTKNKDLIYKNPKSAEALMGMKVRMGQVTIEGYAGQGDQSTYGRKLIGASFALDLGEKSRDHESSARKNKKDDKSSRKNSKKSLDEENLGDQVLQEIDAPKTKSSAKTTPAIIDDFSLVDKKLKDSRLKEKLKSEEEYADNEIERLKLAEQVRKDAKADHSRLEEKRRRAEEQGKFENERSENKKLSLKAKSEVDSLPFVTADELQWQGLD